MTHLQAFAKARSLFQEGHDRDEVIDFLHAEKITGEEAERLADKAQKSAQEETGEDRAFGGPWGKIGIGLLAVGVFVYSVFAMNRMLNIVLLIGLIFLGDGIWRLFKRPAKSDQP